MSSSTGSAIPIRRKIENLGTRLSLPTVRRALGILEGEHPSSRRGVGGDAMGIRLYQQGDEARMIDWQASARMGHPMVVNTETRATSRVWLLLNAGREMTGSCPDGERAADVAANALLMFAALSVRRSDDISLVLADARSIARTPFNGDLAKFETLLDSSLRRTWNTPGDVGAMLDYARHINDPGALLVIALDDTSLGGDTLRAVRSLAQRHPLVVIAVGTVNPFSPPAQGLERIVAAETGRQVPAFLRGGWAWRETAAHREFVAARLRHELTRLGSTSLHASGSEEMLRAFVALVSATMAAPLHAGPRGLIAPRPIRRAEGGR